MIIVSLYLVITFTFAASSLSAASVKPPTFVSRTFVPIYLFPVFLVPARSHFPAVRATNAHALGNGGGNYTSSFIELAIVLGIPL
jgi:hypothetical protein